MYMKDDLGRIFVLCIFSVFFLEKSCCSLGVVDNGRFIDRSAISSTGSVATLNGSEFTTNGTMSGNTFSLSGDQHLVCPHNQAFHVSISGAGNAIHGQPNFANISLDSSATFTLAIQSALNQSIDLNNGHLRLEDDLRLMDNVKIAGGTIHLNKRKLLIGGSYSSSWRDNTNFYDAADISLGGSMSLDGVWTFTGTNVINGNGYALDLASTGSIVLDGVASSLIFDNVILRGVSGTNVRCINPRSTITLRSVDYCMEAATTFSCGALNFINTIKFIGGHQFNYTTGKTSTISANSALWLDENSIFSYAPPLARTRDLLAMTNTSSKLYLENARVKSSTSGMRFTKGTVIIEGIVDFDNLDAKNYAQGFSFGSGTASGDITLLLMPEADLNFKTGYVTFANITRAIPYTR
jgi:hypothetical protein